MTAAARTLTFFDAITFDNYGTLVDWETGIIAALRAWAQHRGLAASDFDLLSAFAQYESAEQVRTPELSYTKILQAVHGRIAAHFDRPLDDEDARAFAGSVADWPVFADTPAALRYLQRHYTLAMISNVDRESFRGTSAKLGITFEIVVTADEVNAYKPSHRNFRAAVEKLAARGIPMDRIVHAGQSFFHDIVPATAFGLATIWIDRRQGRSGWGATPPPPRSDVKPTFVAADLAELVERHRRLVATEGGKRKGAAGIGRR